LIGGWSDISLKAIKANAVIKNNFSVDWSGEICFYLNNNSIHNIYGLWMGGRFMANVKDARGLFSDDEKCKTLGFSESEFKTDQMIRYLLTTRIPNFKNKDYCDKKIKENEYKEFIEKISEIKEKFKIKYPKTKTKPTIILNEIDCNFSIDRQRLFFEKAINSLAKRYQVIIVSNSVFSLSTGNIIDLDNSLEKIKTMFN
jgi:hypothetical protein